MDKAFVQRLHEALVAREYDVWVDWEDIPPSAEWFEEIRTGVRGADGFVYVISPDSVSSEVCTRELQSAVDQSKRIVPVVCREPDTAKVPAPASALNWVFLRDGDDFQAGFQTLISALETDLDHVRVHTRLGVQAGRWDAGGRDRSQLLRGSDLAAAESWLVTGAGKQPEATQLQREYLLASRQAATRRQRTVIGGVSLALVIAIALAIVALVQRSTAIHERNIAYARQLDADALNSYATDPELSVLLATRAAEVQPTAQSESALRAALAQSNVRSRDELSAPAGGDVLWSPDGRRLLITSPNSGSLAWARIYTPGSDAPPISMPGPSARQDSGWDASGDRVVIGGGHPAVYDAATGRLIMSIPGTALHAALNADGSRVVTVDIHSIGHVYAVPSGRLVATFTPHLTGGADCFALSPNGRFAAQCDALTFSRLNGTVPSDLDVWSTQTGRLVRSISVNGLIVTVAFSPDSSQFVFTVNRTVANPAALSPRALGAVEGLPGTFVYHTLGRGPPVISFPEDGSAAVFSPNTLFPALAYATLTGNAYVYEFYSHQSIPLLGAGDVIESVNFDPSGGYVVTAGRDDVIRVYNASDGGAPIETLAGHQDRVVDASIGGSDYYVASSSDDGTARLWQGPAPIPALRLSDAPSGDGAAATIGFIAGGRRIVEAGTGRTYSGEGRIFDAASLDVVATFHAPAGQALLGATAGRDGPILTLSTPLVNDKPGGAGPVQSFNVASGVRLATILPPAGSEIIDAVPSHSGSDVVTLEPAGRAEIWDARSGRLLHVLAGQSTEASAAAFSRNGSLLAIAHYPLLPAPSNVNVTTQFGAITVQLWNVASGRLLRTIQGPRLTSEITGTASYAPLAVAFSPDGGLLALSGTAGAVDVFDPQTGTLVRHLSIAGFVAGSTASTLAFSPDGTLLAAGAEAGAYVWRLPAFSLLPVFQHVPAGAASLLVSSTGEIRVGFTDDSRYLETLGDQTLEVWNVPDHLQVFHDSPVLSGGVDPAATKIVTATAFGVSLYPCQLCGDLTQLLALARRRVTRGFTPAERALYLSQG